jgi:ABC-2 type transport system ATP-binding protein
MSRTAVAELEGVVKDYRSGLLGRRKLRALAGVTLRVEAGEVLGLLGPNRAGKTTLLKILLSLCRPTAGRVSRFGRPASDLRSLGRVGYVHDNQALPRYLSPTALLEYYGALSLVPYQDVKRRVPVLLEQVGLADRSHEPISHFSKGMVQRLGVAQALVNDPDLLVLDEPSQGLDVAGRRLVRELVLQQRRRGKTVLLVSHLLTEVEAVCDRVAVLVDGRLVHAGSLSALVPDPDAGATGSLERAVQKYWGSKAS